MNLLPMSLGRKGLILVSILLLLEFLFVGGLWFMLDRAEQEARAQEHMRDISVKTNRLIELNYIALYSLRDLAGTHDSYHAVKYKRSVDEIRELLDWLENNLPPASYQKTIVLKLKSKFSTVMEIVDGAMRYYEGEGGLLELKELMRKRSNFETLNREMIPDFQDLLRAQRNMEASSPEKEKQWREQSKNLLACGLCLNILVALALSFFFTRGIVWRLSILMDNTRRLKAGDSLRPRIEGSDEIAYLDRAFHDMAGDLQISREKERKALDESRESERKVQSMIASMPVGLILSDESGGILYSNQSMLEMLKTGEQELEGKNVDAFFPSFSFISEIAEVDKNDSCPVTTVLRVGPNESRDVEVSFTPFDLGMEKKFLITVQDISDRMEAQRLRQSLVAMVSHELRTPLNSVQSFLELAEMGALGDLPCEAKDGLSRASRNVDRLVRLINDLLDLEKMESGKMSANLELCELDEIFEQSREAVEWLLEKERVDIIMPSPGSGLVVHCDFERIVQVMINLLGNAIKFSPRDGKIIIQAIKDDNRILVSVIDEGPGIEEEYQELIFERWAQLPAAEGGLSQGDRHKSTGLGLAICKAIVEMHGQTIGICRASDASVSGSRFWFYLTAAD